MLQRLIVAWPLSTVGAFLAFIWQRRHPRAIEKICSGMSAVCELKPGQLWHAAPHCHLLKAQHLCRRQCRCVAFLRVRFLLKAMRPECCPQQVAVGQGVLGQPFDISVPKARLWSLDDPFLYTLNVSLYASTTPIQSTKAVSSFQAQASHMCLHDSLPPTWT